MRIVFILLVSLGLVPIAGAQQLLKGKIYDAQTDSVMPSVTIFNASRKLYVLSTRDGDYAIAAQEGDKLILTSVGYVPDTVKVLNYMIDAGYDISMNLKNTYLKNVNVRAASYQSDSLKRREGYDAFYNRPKNEIVSKSGPQNGVGMSFSPISFFSRKSKDKKMNKNLQYQEEQDFVDYAFSRRYVEKLTNLHGDSLTSFMLRYRPSYLFCRGANSEDMLRYINDKYILYMKHEDAINPKSKQ